MGQQLKLNSERSVIKEGIGYRFELRTSKRVERPGDFVQGKHKDANDITDTVLNVSPPPRCWCGSANRAPSIQPMGAPYLTKASAYRESGSTLARHRNERKKCVRISSGRRPWYPLVSAYARPDLSGTATAYGLRCFGDSLRTLCPAAMRRSILHMYMQSETKGGQNVHMDTAEDPIQFCNVLS
jgi:hypothetical protein